MTDAGGSFMLQIAVKPLQEINDYYCLTNALSSGTISDSL